MRDSIRKVCGWNSNTKVMKIHTEMNITSCLTSSTNISVLWRLWASKIFKLIFASSFNQLCSLRSSNYTLKPYQVYTINETFKEVSLSKTNANSNEKEICCFLSSIQRASKLNFSMLSIAFDVALAIAYDIQRLIHLSLDKCDLNPFTFAHVKKLRFLDKDRKVVLRIILVKRQIEWMEISKNLKCDIDICNAMNIINLCKPVEFR